MTTQESSKSSLLVGQAHEEIKGTPEKARVSPKIAQVKTEKQAGLKMQETLAETPEPSAIPQAEIEPGPQVSIHVGQATAEAEHALAKGRKASQGEVKNTKLPLPTPEGKDTEQRVSFVVRLTVDEQGRPRRTEIEHAKSGQKEVFPILDGQRLVAFIQAHLSPQVTSELHATLEPLPAITKATSLGSPRPNANLILSEVRVLQKGTSGNIALMLDADEACEVQVRFQLLGSQAHTVTAQESSYEMRVYAQGVTSGSFTLLTRHQANLVNGILEYTLLAPVPGLSPGFYRLLTVVTVFSPTPIASYYEGPAFEVQPPACRTSSQPSTMTR